MAAAPRAPDPTDAPDPPAWWRRMDAWPGVGVHVGPHKTLGARDAATLACALLGDGSMGPRPRWMERTR